MKKLFLFYCYVTIASVFPGFVHGNNAENNSQYENNISKNAINLVGTFWMYIDGNGTGMLIHFVSDNWVKCYEFSENDNMNSGQDNYYKINYEILCTYQIAQSNNNTGEIWNVEGDWRELVGTFVISGNTMGFTNKKRTKSWTLKKTDYIPDCIRRQL